MSSDEPEGINFSDEKIKKLMKKKRQIIKDPFEAKKQALRDKQENIHGAPDNPYREIKIPTGQKVGDKCVIKFNKPVPKAEVAVSQKIEFKKRDKYDKQSEPEIVCRAFILDQHVAKGDKLLKEVSFMWEDIGTVAQKATNLLQAGEYLIEVRVWSTNAGEETNSKRLVNLK